MPVFVSWPKKKGTGSEPNNGSAANNGQCKVPVPFLFPPKGQGAIAMTKPWMRCMLLLSLGLAGCSSLAKPNWTAPGSAQVQQGRALRYDPYPENEPGPALTGTRPLGYQTPIPETSRSRWFLGNWGQ